MAVNKFLDLSTEYLSKGDAKFLINLSQDEWLVPHFPRVVRHTYGWFIHVSLDDTFIESYSGIVDAKMSLNFCRIYKYARDKKCWWINFDRDGEDENIPNVRRFSR